MTATRHSDTFRHAFGAARVSQQRVDQVLNLVRAWNDLIPKNRVRILNDLRFREAAYTLDAADQAGVEVREIIEAMRFYGQSKWQRQNGAYKSFENWIDWNNVVRWIEKAEEQADRREFQEHLREQRAIEVRQADRQNAAHVAASRAFDELSRAERVQWMQLAADKHRRQNKQELPRDRQRTEAVRLFMESQDDVADP